MKNRIKISANKKHKRPLNEGIRDEHNNLMKTYKRLCRFKQIDFWKKQKQKFNDDNTKFWDIWKTLGEEVNLPEHINNVNGNDWEMYFYNLYIQKR